MAKPPKEPKKKGRPTKRTPERVARILDLVKEGKTDKQVVKIVDVSISAFKEWKKENEPFAALIKEKKEEADQMVEASLYRRATGYTKVVETIRVDVDGKETREMKTIESYPPDVNAAKFWLTNRRHKEWKERLHQELGGPDGGPVQINSTLDQVLTGILSEIKGKKE